MSAPPEVVCLSYGDGSSAIMRQPDGSGIANYPSKRKAICVCSFGRGRRFNAMIYDDSDAALDKAAPVHMKKNIMPGTMPAGSKMSLFLRIIRLFPDPFLKYWAREMRDSVLNGRKCYLYIFH